MSRAIELLTVGDELLLGTTVDRNSAWLGLRLGELGIRVVRRTSVGDDDGAIQDAASQALARTGLVICTGGLGPTEDDRTVRAIAALFGRELVVDEEVLESIRERFRVRGIEMPASNVRQAEVPVGARVLPNPRGTAPGLILEDDAGRAIILLPGVPAEMRAIFDASVVDYLRARWPGEGTPILYRVLRTTSIPESTLADRLGPLSAELAPLTVAYLPSVRGVDIRLTVWGDLDRTAAERAFDAAEARIRGLVGDYVYGRDAEDLADVVADRLLERGATLAVAESCTGGLIAKRLTDRAGASGFFQAGLVTYANSAKRDLLGVAAETLGQHGAVSEATALEMAAGALRAGRADYAIAVTGIAGPGGATPGKPVGTVWIAVGQADRSVARRFVFSGDREEVRERAAQMALWLLLRWLEAPDSLLDG